MLESHVGVDVDAVLLGYELTAAYELEALESERLEARAVYEKVAGDLLDVVEKGEVVGGVQRAVLLVVVLVGRELVKRRVEERMKVADLQVAVDVHAVLVDGAPLEVVVGARAERGRCASTYFQKGNNQTKKLLDRVVFLYEKNKIKMKRHEKSLSLCLIHSFIHSFIHKTKHTLSTC